MSAESADVRWKQRLASLQKALARLDEGVAIASPSAIELQGTIKAFEICFELGWNVLKDFLRPAASRTSSGRATSSDARAPSGCSTTPSCGSR